MDGTIIWRTFVFELSLGSNRPTARTSKVPDHSPDFDHKSHPDHYFVVGIGIRRTDNFDTLVDHSHFDQIDLFGTISAEKSTSFRIFFLSTVSFSIETY